MVGHYRQYQRKRRHEEKNESLDSEPTQIAGAVDVGQPEVTVLPATTCDASGFSTTNFLCTRCHTLKPTTQFYQSCLARKAFYCKSCSAKRSKTSNCVAIGQLVRFETDSVTQVQQPMPSPDAVATTGVVLSKRLPRPVTDMAVRLLNQLRRKCHQPSRLLQRVQGRTAKERCTIGFDVKVMRSLLKFWQHGSAISHAVVMSPPPLAPVPADIANTMTATTTNTTGHAIGSDATDSGAIAGSAEHECLELVIWMSPVEQIVEPWHVIPVTHTQARRLRLVPAAKWPCMLPMNTVTLIEQRLAHLKELFSIHSDNHII